LAFPKVSAIASKNVYPCPDKDALPLKKSLELTYKRLFKLTFIIFLRRLNNILTRSLLKSTFAIDTIPNTVLSHV